jgi:hypothetical protein
METTFDYLRQFGPLLAERILETYPPLQSTKDPVAPSLAGLLRKPCPRRRSPCAGKITVNLYRVLILPALGVNPGGVGRDLRTETHL